MLVEKAYEALPDNGLLVIYDIFNDEKREKTFSLLLSQQMTIRFGGTHIVHSEFGKMLNSIGFTDVQVTELSGIHDLVVAVKKTK